MATASLHSLISNEKLGGSTPAVSTSLHIQSMPQTRYESDEEDESELDIPATRDDRFFSTPDADCDIAIGSCVTTDHVEGGFELTMPPSEEQKKMHRRQGMNTPQRSSVYTVRRISGLTLLPPLQTSEEQLQQHQRKNANASRSRSPSATPRARAERPATMIFEQEEIDSIYSDTASDYDDGSNDNGNESDLGDDTDTDIQGGGAIDESFFVATPITYHLPKGRPSLVSISPPPSQSGRSPQMQSQAEEQSPRAQKKQKKQSNSVSLERTDSGISRNSSTGGSIKRSLQHLKAKKNESRRSACVPSEPSPISPSTAMNATSPMLGSTPPDSAKFFTETKKHKQASSESRRRSLIPGQLRSGRRDRNVSEQTPPPTDSEAPKNAQNEPSQIHNQGHRRRATEKIPSFNKVAWTPASPPTSPSDYNSTPLNSPLPAPQKLPISVPEPLPSPGIRKTKTFQITPPNNHLDQLPVPRTRARTRSISSIASNASKFSLPAFDSASLKAIAQKYQNRTTSPLPGTASPTPSTSSNLRPAVPDSPRRPSDCGSTMSERLSLPPRHKFLRTMSTTNLSMLMSAQDTIDEDSMGAPYQSKSNLGRKSKRYSSTSKMSISTGRSGSSNNTHIRSKSIKWLQGTSESMTLAGNKLGSMLRKKSVAVPTNS